MSLEASQVFKAVAGKVIAIAGRFAHAVRYAPVEMKLHLIHGEQDAVVSSQYSIQAQQQLKLLGLEATLDLLSGLGHGIDERALQLVSRYLN
jgi:phospholipase/carboxylesterase